MCDDLAFSQRLCDGHALRNTVGVSSPRPIVIHLGLPCLKIDALVVRILKQWKTFVRTCFFTSSLAPRNIRRHLPCAHQSCVVVTRLALCCVCDHEKLMNFTTALFSNSVLGILGNLLVLLSSFSGHNTTVNTSLLGDYRICFINDFRSERCLSSSSDD